MNDLNLNKHELDSVLMALIQYTTMLVAGASILNEDELEEVTNHVEVIEKAIFKLKQHTDTVLNQ